MNKQAKAIAIPFFLFVAAVYLLFPNNNSSADAFGYAASAKYGAWLFSPHHLLYNFFMHLVSKPLLWLIPSMDVLAMAKGVNSMVALGTLVLLFKLLGRLGQTGIVRFLMVALVAFSFGPWRFATENEAYTIPIFLSMMGTSYFLKYLQVKSWKKTIVAGIFCAVAALFHQIHFFWWLIIWIGIFFYNYNWKHALAYFLPAILVPIAYVLVVFNNEGQLTFGNFFFFIFHDYASGTINTKMGLHNVFFMAVALFRTFLQVYPYIIQLVIKYPFTLVLGVLSLIGLIYFAVSLLRKSRRNEKHAILVYFGKVHIWIILCQLFFAFFSSGNAEFMVMLPILLCVVLASFFRLHKVPLMVGASSLLLWNLTFGILPLNVLKLNDIEGKVRFVEAHPEAIIINPYNHLRNRFQYAHGFNAANNFKLDEELDSVAASMLITSNKTVFTDMVHDTLIVNRGSYANRNLDSNFWKNYQATVADSFETFYGTTYIYKISVHK